MAQQPSSRQIIPPAFDDQLVAFPTRNTVDTTTEALVTSAVQPAAGSQSRVRRYAFRQVAVVAAAGPLRDVVEELDLAIQVALTERSRGVVCDLSAVPAGASPAATEAIAAAGRHARVWPGIPVAVACPDPQVREALLAAPLGRHLIVTNSLFSAMTAVLATRTLTIERLRLSHHPTAPDESRDFVEHTLSSWRLGPVIPSASLVISELVGNSMMDADADIDLSIVWNLGALRLGVRDSSPELLREPYSHSDPHGRRLSVIAVLSRAYGVLPTADGGKVSWAVLEASRTRPGQPVRAVSQCIG